MRKVNTLFIIILGLFTSSCQRPVLMLDPLAKLKAIQVTCEQNTVPQSVYLPCEAMGVYSDNSVRPITYEASWTFSDPSTKV